LLRILSDKALTNNILTAPLPDLKVRAIEKKDFALVRCFSPDKTRAVR